EEMPKGVTKRLRVRNTSWGLTLLLVPGENTRTLIISDKSTIKNIHPSGRTQALANPHNNRGILFELWQGKGRSPLWVAAEPMPAGATRPLDKTYATTPVNLSQPFAVRQKFDWETSPVRRIDALELARHSHRTVTSGLKVRQDLKDLDP